MEKNVIDVYTNEVVILPLITYKTNLIVLSTKQNTRRMVESHKMFFLIFQNVKDKIFVIAHTLP